MSVRGTVTFECDQRGCRAETVYVVEHNDYNIDRDGLNVLANAAGWRADDHGGLVCPRCADEHPHEKGDDDGVEYADPRDARAERL